MKKLVCKKCGSANINVSMVAEQKKRGCLGVCGWLFLAVFTFGAVLWFPLLSKKGTKTQKYVVCQDCGYSWKK